MRLIILKSIIIKIFKTKFNIQKIKKQNFKVTVHSKGYNLIIFSYVWLVDVISWF